jgi:flavodoxin
VLQLRSLLVVVSYHHKNTEKIAKVMAEVLGAEIKTPKQVSAEALQEYDLVGFGSGIYGARHHRTLLELAGRASRVTSKKAFIFSTCGVPAAGMTEEVVAENHSALRDKLQAKGYTIVDEFGCAGLNTNSFLRVFGGINKGRPNADDLKRAEEFAHELKQKL